MIHLEFILTLIIHFIASKECINQGMRSLIDHLEKMNVIDEKRISEVMCMIDRKDFTDINPYLDS